MADALESYLSHFQLTTFRPGQRDVIDAVMHGSDCLCIMPTGGGKSLCYQLPATARGGLTLVVSPLIALMKDQVDQLTARGIAATYINSSLTPAEQNKRLEAVGAGTIRLLYIAPERLRNNRFYEVVRGIKVGFLAVDEAHCISEWGHDFRPDYSRLGKFRRRLGFPQTIALTATATPDVREDVIRQLELRQPRVFISGFARDNLHFEVQTAGGNIEKNETLLEFLRAQTGAGIIYAGTRKRCVELMELVGRELKRRIGFYHAGLPQDERRRVQDEFMSGRTPWLVATNAFGMGVDKRDLRFVVHYDIPGSIEAYYQEAGRAGRDALPSRCLLIFSEHDRYLREFFIENAYPPREVVAKIYDYLRDLKEDPIELTQEEVKEKLSLPVGNEAVSVSERLLEKAGVLERIDAGENQGSVRISGNLPSLIDLLPVDAKMQRKVLQGVEKIVGDVRDDRVFFNPARLAANLEIEPASLTRALRELNKLRDFDYVQPFRGRAIHMLERAKPFAELQIDFAELEKRKAAEYGKLDKMMDYARSRGCRQVFVLDYFGDDNKRPCGLCDNCGGVQDVSGVSPLALADPSRDKSAPATVEDEGVSRVVRMALAGVARTKGRVGKSLVAKMLCGSEAKDVVKRGFQKLSTFGLFKSLGQTETVAFLDELQRVRLLEQVETEKFRPTIQLSALGEAVMRSEKPLPANLKLDRELIAKLRDIRPAPETKREPPSAAPQTTVPPPHFTEVSFEAYEPASFAVNSFEPSPPAFDEATYTPPEPAEPPPAARPDFYWTWKLLHTGFSPAECRAIRQLDEAAYLIHLLRAVDEGLAVEWSWGLSREQYQLLADEAAGGEGGAISGSVGLRREHRRLFDALAAGRSSADLRGA